MIKTTTTTLTTIRKMNMIRHSANFPEKKKIDAYKTSNQAQEAIQKFQAASRHLANSLVPKQ